MEFRRLGRSGLSVSEISYGNWITHGSQVEEDQAHACVRAALDAGITTFDTADVYANTRAESVLGRALSGQRRESLEIFTKVFWPTGPGGPNDGGLSRKHIIESANASLQRLQTDYVDLYQAHRFDESVPLEETFLAFADLVRAGKVLYIGVSEWNADQIERGAELARELKVPFISNQPQYSMLWRVIEAEVIPASEQAGLSQIVWSPIGQGVLTGKYLPGQAPPAGSRATDESGGKDVISRLLDRRGAGEGPAAQADRRGRGPVDGAAGHRVGAAEPQRRLGDHRRHPARAGHRERQGIRCHPRRRRPVPNRQGPRRRRPDRPVLHRLTSPGGGLGGVQAHGSVDLVVVGEQRHLVDALVA